MEPLPAFLVVVIQLVTGGLLLLAGFILRNLSEEIKALRARMHKVEGEVAVHSALFQRQHAREDRR